MTEAAPDTTGPEAAPDTTGPTADGDDGKHVYDHALLRFVDNAPGKNARQTAAALNKDNKVGRADGGDGKRYTVV